MSNYQSTYVGPYIIVKTKTVDVTERRECQNGHNVRSSRDRFCPECGMEIEVRQYTKEVDAHIGTLEDWGVEEDRFFNPEYPDMPLFLPNQGNHLKTVDADYADQAIISLSNEVIRNGLVAFKQDYAEELKILDANCEYELNYGVVAVSF